MSEITIKHKKTWFGLNKIDIVVNDEHFFTLGKNASQKMNIKSDIVNIKIGKNLCIGDFTVKKNKDTEHIEIDANAFSTTCVMVCKNNKKYNIPNTKYYQDLIWNLFILLLIFSI